jgi:uncharacterized membrane protein
MTAIFEWFFKYRPLLYERGTISFQPLWPDYVTWILIAAAIAGSFLLYRRLAGNLPVPWRYTLACLRAASFLVVLLLLLRPVLRLHSVIPQKNFVAIAYDSSRSMEIKDGPRGQSRLQLEQAILRPVDNNLLAQLTAKFRLRFFRFSGSAERTEAFADLSSHGGITDLERSLNQISNELASAPVAGVVLITDGADNRSKNLEATAAQLRARRIPVYSVGVGSSDFMRDVEVLRVTAPKTVLKDTTIEAEVSVQSIGYPGQRRRLVVLDRDKQLNSQEIMLGSDGEVKTYKVSFNCQSAGPKVYKFLVEPFPEEVIPENNDQTVLVRVEDEQPRVLYFEGEPRWEYGFLRRAILQDKNIRLVSLLRQADGKFLGQGESESAAALAKGFPTEKAELFKYKAIILGSVEASFFTFDQLQILSDFVSRRGGGFLMLGGKNSFGQGGYIHTPLEDVSPLVLGQSSGAAPAFQDLEYRIRLTGYGLQHPICRLSLSEDQNRKRWESAPALIGFNPTFGPKPGAIILAQGTATDARGQSPILLAFQRFGKGKAVAFATASSWRWRMGQDHSDNFHELFWKQMLRWLAGDVHDPVTVTAEKHSYSPDDTAVFRAEVFDSAFLPLNDARLITQIKSPSGQFTSVPMDWDAGKDGAYSGTFKPIEDGIYEVSTEAFQGDKSLGSAKTNFRVSRSTEEFHNATLNSDLLKRLSKETGGRYYAPGDIHSLPEDISYIDKGSSRIEEKDLWDMPFLFLLLAGLLSTEWILRKRKGLA